MRHPFIIIICFFFTVTTSWGSTQVNNDFFEEYYQIINQNINQGHYENNLVLIKKIQELPAYQNLDCYHQGKINHKIGVSYYLLNRENEAITHFKNEVLKTWQNCQQVPQTEKANTIYNIGVSYQYINNLESAKLYIDKALYIFENDPKYPRSQLALKYHGIGKFYKNINDAFRAELYFLNAINLYKEQNLNKQKEFGVLNDLIGMSMEFKNYVKCKKYIEEALSIHDEFPKLIPYLDLALIYLNAGTTYLGLKEYNTAQRMAQKAFNLLDKQDEPFYYSIAVELLAIINADQENFKLAEQYMTQVLEIRKQLYAKGEHQDSMARGYENLCDILIRKGDDKKANQYLNKAFDILLPSSSFDADHIPIIRKSKIFDDRHLIRLIELKVKIYEVKFEDSNNIKFLKKALTTQHKIDSVINRSLVSFQFEQSKLDFLNLKFEHYGKAVQDALKLYKITGDQFYLEEAYYFSSKTKAIVLQYELNQVDAFKSNVSEDVIRKEKALRNEMHTQQALLSEATHDSDSLLQIYTKAQYELDSYLTEIEQKEPTYFKEKYAFIRPPQVKDMQKALPKDMVIIEYFLSKDMIYSFWLTNDDFIPITIPYNNEIKTALDNFSVQCHNPNTAVSPELSEMIFEKLLQKGLKEIDQKIKRLCIIPDGQLHKLSFEALIDRDKNPDKYLIQDYAISYSYSISLLLREHHDKDLESYIGFGTKYSNSLNEKLKARKRFFGDENLMQLALSHEEIKRGSAIFDGNIFIDNEASLSNFLKHSDKADIIHLSLHGLVDIDDPNRSCIIFDDDQEEFILSPLDLYGNRINADLVLLSTCHSASGKIYNGEGVQGMSKSFLLGGAHNILSSLWNASEASSMTITTSFLEYVHEGQPIDLALHQSKLDYLSKIEPNKRHPYYWANFILLGEIGTPQQPVNPILWIGIVAFFILLFFILSTSKIWRKSQKT